MTHKQIFIIFQDKRYRFSIQYHCVRYDSSDRRSGILFNRSSRRSDIRSISISAINTSAISRQKRHRNATHIPWKTSHNGHRLCVLTCADHFSPSSTGQVPTVFTAISQKHPGKFSSGRECLRDSPNACARGLSAPAPEDQDVLGIACVIGSTMMMLY